MKLNYRSSGGDRISSNLAQISNENQEIHLNELKKLLTDAHAGRPLSVSAISGLLQAIGESSMKIQAFADYISIISGAEVNENKRISQALHLKQQEVLCFIEFYSILS